MATHIFHGGNGAISQVANAWTYDAVAPVRLKKDGDPGLAPHANQSTQLWNPLGTIREFGTEMANRWSALDVGQHAESVLVGYTTGVRDFSNAFYSHAKTVYHEAGEMVHHGVTTLVNAVMVKLSPGLKQTIDNIGDVLGGLGLEHFESAAADKAKDFLDMLKDPATYGGLAVSLGATLVQGVPVVGQIVGGAVAVDRAMGIAGAGADAAQELQDILAGCDQPLTPGQLEAKRKRLAAWIVGSGASLIAALAGRRLPLKRNSRSEGEHDHKVEANSNKKGDTNQTPKECVCAFPVIVATGEKSLTETDFSLPGPIPLMWQRRYRSGNAETSPWGPGWRLAYTAELRVGAEGLIYLDEQGRHVVLAAVAPGETSFDPVEKLTVARPEPHCWTLAFKDGLTHHFVRHDPAQWRLPLAAIADRNGNAIRLDWQRPDARDPDAFSFAAPRLTGLTDSAGRRLRLVWENARLAAVELDGAPAHCLVRYAYDADGHLIATERAGAPWRRYAWRGGVLVGYRKASGHRFFAEYDAEGPHGRVLRSWCADGAPETFSFAYDPRHRRTRMTDALGRHTLMRYDGRFNIVETVRPDGARIATPFDARDNPRGSIDPLGRRTTWRHDARGNLTAIVQPDGATTTRAYGALDLPVTLTDALGQRWLREYDARGNLLASTDPLGRTTRYAWDAAGRLAQLTDARGGVKRLAWDAAHNLVAYTDCSGHTTRFAYDALGRLTARTDALGHTTRYRWNALGQLIEVAEPAAPDRPAAVHRYAWDGEDNLLAYTDPLGAVTAYTYDGLGRPLSRRDAAGRTLAYTYDAAGRLVRLTNENGAHTRFRYDLADHLTDEIGFDGRHQRYGYNAAGELTHLIEAGGTDAGPGKVTRFTRDAMGRLVDKRAEADPGCASRFSYDKLGRLTAAHNPAATLAFAYDPAGQLVAETQTLAGAAPRVLAHGYDALGNRVRTRLPDGRVLNWLFYGSGHLHQVNLEADGAHHTLCDFERDALHRETARSQGRLASRFDYDPMGRLTRHRCTVTARHGERLQGAPVVERHYGWDAAGHLVAREDALRGTQHFRYDPTGRILEATGPRPETFAFDPAGNLLDPIERALGFGLGDNRLTVFEDLRFDYDAHGNLTRRRKGAHQDAHFTWNADHQLTEATVTRHGVTQTTRYEYDALGRRTRKRDAFGATEYLWDRDLMIESRRGERANLFLFEPAGFVPLATVQDGETYWYHCDQIGAPLELTDANGALVWAVDYRVWGEATLRKTGTDGRAVSTGTPPPPIEQPFRFQGQQFDAETGLHYNRFRYYDPAVGRFVSQDPIGLRGGVNLFTYAPNPLDGLDPFGLTGAKGTLSGPNIPGGTVTGLSTGEGGNGISNPAVQEAYDAVPAEQRSLHYHGECAEADALSKAANAAGVETIEDLKQMAAGSESEVWRNDKKMKPMPACPSCAHVQGQLGITDKCKK